MSAKKTRDAASERILVLNPGSTSTKLAVFDGAECAFEDKIVHTPLDLSGFKRIWDQYEYRKAMILEFLDDRGVALHTLAAVVGRGGVFAPTVSGTYAVNQQMIDDARTAERGEHASNLGAVLAYGIAWDLGIPSFIVDPPCVDELDAIARYSGLPEIPRTSLVHALNVKATGWVVTTARSISWSFILVAASAYAPSGRGGWSMSRTGSRRDRSLRRGRERYRRSIW
jgi:butyrate kinase